MNDVPKITINKETGIVRVYDSEVEDKDSGEKYVVFREDRQLANRIKV